MITHYTIDYRSWLAAITRWLCKRQIAISSLGNSCRNVQNVNQVMKVVLKKTMLLKGMRIEIKER